MDSEGVLKFWYRLCVLDDEEIRGEILHEAHRSSYTILLGGTKMYRDLKTNFLWPGIKKDVGRYVAPCLVLRRSRQSTNFQ